MGSKRAGGLITGRIIEIVEKTIVGSDFGIIPFGRKDNWST